MSDIQILIEDLRKYEKEINFTLLKMNWLISKQQQKSSDPKHYKKMDKDMITIIQIAKQLQDLELFMPELIVTK